jgi:sugar phosphate isomerase/epimerase
MTSLTALTEIMAADTELAVSRLRDLGIDELDLKDDIFGRQIEDLEVSRRRRLTELLERSGARAYCLSSSLGSDDVSVIGELEFRTRMERGVLNLLETIPYVRPRLVRLLACAGGPPTDDPVSRVERLSPWVFDAYREAADALASAGPQVTVENEPESVLSEPDAVHAFFARLDRPLDRVGFTWDIQNMWAAGTFPTLAVYEQLRELIDYVHLKGGRDSPASPRILTERALLERASWPVQELVGRIILDDVSPVLCINVSGPDLPIEVEDPGELWAAEAVRDIDYLRRTFSAIGATT